MKRDPLELTTSLIFNLSLLEKNETYNINELKTLRNLNFHWNTIFKYLKLFKIIQKYCPTYELIDSKLHITNTKIFNRLNEKEKFILYLFNRDAIVADKAIEIPNKFNITQIKESIGILYEKLDSGRFYLNAAGLNVYRSIKQNLSDLIFNEKQIDDLFPQLYFEESEKPTYNYIINIEKMEPIVSYSQNFIYYDEKEENDLRKIYKEISIERE